MPAATSAPARFASVMPGFAVGDLARSVQFFTTVLGFRQTFSNGPSDAPTFAIVARDGVEISLSLERAGHAVGRSGCYLKLEAGIDSLYADCVRHGIELAHELRDESYGMREFMIHDPDGNTLNFGQPLLS